MKRKILAFFMAIVVAVTTLIMPAAAAGTTQFSDVSDQNTRTAIETLKMMGVLDGYGDGTFRPANQLTRAQFSKMASYAMNAGNELGLYKTVTIFPDVKPSHWAAGYINLAAKGKGIIAGYPDGKFYPERTVTVGQAVTILLRLLGYKDEHVGGVWPDSYMSAGAMIGLTTGVGTDGNAPLTRAQAARLFVNLLQAEKKEGGTLYALSEETQLLSVDGGTGTIKTTLKDEPMKLVNPIASSALVGCKGRLVMAEDKVLTFLPESFGSSGKSNAAVIVYTDKSAVGFEELAGNHQYQIYKNGIPATKNDLRKNDVATYYAETNSILVCDTRVSVYYESCEPNPAAPTEIEVLGGTKLYVLPTARDSLSKFKPGMQMTLLLTADGQVAGAVESSGATSRNNAIGIVSATGKVRMLCGNTMIEIAGEAKPEVYGQAVRISSNNKDRLNLTAMSGGVSGELNVSNRTLGKKQLADNVMLVENGEQIAIGDLTSGVIKEAQIRYAHTNWTGEVDLIVLNRETGEIYGRVFREVTKIPVYNDDGTLGEPEYEEKVGIEYGNGTEDRVGPFEREESIRTGDYAVAKINRGGTGFSMLTTLTQLKNVSESAWIGRTAVIHGGRTYEVPETVLCYNLDSKEWVTLDAALAYSNTANLYARDGVIRVVEVKYTMK